MPPPKYYAVANGRSSGVYQSWGECDAQVNGFSGARYKSFSSPQEAQNFVNSHRGGHSSSSSGYQSYSEPQYYATSSNSSYNPKPSYSSSHRGFHKDGDGFVEVYTDGACSANGRQDARAGLGVYWGDGHELNTSAPVSGRATNNSGEIQAATRAMKQALDNGVDKLAINTDSKFLVDSATKWMPGWKENNWKLQSGGPVKNEADFKELDRLQNQLEVKWNHVDAHKGVHGNEMADQLAKSGAAMYNKK